MKYPTLPVQNESRQFIDTFLGYNHRLKIGDGEFYDMTNMTSDSFPALSPRGARGLYKTVSRCGGLISKDELCYVDGGDIVIGEERIALGLTEGDKNLVSMGAYIIVFPDKKYVNTADLTDYGNIESSFTTNLKTVTYTLKPKGGNIIDGSPDGGFLVLLQNPGLMFDGEANPALLFLSIDSSVSPPILRKHVGRGWEECSCNVTIESTGIGKKFEVGDSIVYTSNDPIARGLKGNEKKMTIVSKSNNMIEVDGLAPQLLQWVADHNPVWDGESGYEGIDTTTEVMDSSIKVEHKLPIMDYVIESGNRLWGCRYGEDIDGNMVNEIYASQLGSFKNWHSFQGISTDSYATSLGTDGAFTGAVTYHGSPIFFKENVMHRITGNMPSQYQTHDIACRGVQSGSAGSIAVLNEVLYYKSRHGVCAYDGSLPVEISRALGDVSYFDACAGAYGNKYYISMADSKGVYHLFVYDVSKDMWHREDNTHVRQFCAHKNELYFIDDDSSRIRTIFGSGTKESEDTEWSVESGIIGLETADKKYISRITVRMNMDYRARAHFYIQYDSENGWEHIATMVGHKTRSVSVPIRPRRCDHFRIKIEGVGQEKIFSICKTFEEGSEI